LITNILYDNELSPGDVLREYKMWNFLSVFLKNPVYFDGIYVKNTERVVAIGYFLDGFAKFMHCCSAGHAVTCPKETKPLVIPGKRKSFSPTETMLLKMLKPLTIITF